MIFRLSVNSHDTQVASVGELRQTLTRFASEEFREIWVKVDRGPRLCALLNGNIGWLMYLSHDGGDTGFSSRNLVFEAPNSILIEYQLSNGQRDRYPAGWALPEQEIMRALEYFVEHQGGRAPSVQWHDDADR
jgi:hypothetical protein